MRNAAVASQIPAMNFATSLKIGPDGKQVGQ